MHGGLQGRVPHFFPNPNSLTIEKRIQGCFHFQLDEFCSSDCPVRSEGAVGVFGSLGDSPGMLLRVEGVGCCYLRSSGRFSTQSIDILPEGLV